MVEFKNTVVTDPNAADLPQATLNLQVIGGNLDGRVLRIRARKCSIGSAAECGIRIHSPTARPLHCVVFRGRQGVFVRRWAPDTLLNGKAFQEAWLKPGDRLSVGPVEFVVLDDAPLKNSSHAVHAAPSPSTPRDDAPKRFGRRDRPNVEEPVEAKQAERSATTASPVDPDALFDQLNQIQAQLEDRHISELQEPVSPPPENDILQSMRRQLDNTEAKAAMAFEQAVQDRAQLQRQTEAWQKERLALGDELNALRDRMEQLSQTSQAPASQNEERDALREEIVVLEEHIGELRRSLAEADALRRREVRERDEALQAQRDEFQTERENLAERIHNLEHEVQTHLNSENDAHAADLRLLQEEHDARESEFSQLRNDFEIAQQENLGLRDELGQLQGQLANAASGATQLETQLQVLQTTLADREGALVQLQQASHVSTESLRAECERMNRELQEAREQTSSLEGEFQSLQVLQAELEAKENQRSAFEEQFETLQRERSQFAARAETLASALEQFKREAEIAAETDNAASQEEVDQLKQDLHQAQEELEQARYELAARPGSADWEHLETRLAEMETLCEQEGGPSEEIAQLRERLALQEEELETLRAASDLKDSGEPLSGQVADELTASQEELLELRSQLEQKQKQWDDDRQWIEEELESRAKLLEETAREKAELERRMVEALESRDRAEAELSACGDQGNEVASKIPELAPGTPSRSLTDHLARDAGEDEVEATFEAADTSEELDEQSAHAKSFLDQWRAEEESELNPDEQTLAHEEHNFFAGGPLEDDDNTGAFGVPLLTDEIGSEFGNAFIQNAFGDDGYSADDAMMDPYSSSAFDAAHSAPESSDVDTLDEAGQEPDKELVSSGPNTESPVDTASILAEFSDGLESPMETDLDSSFGKQNTLESLAPQTVLDSHWNQAIKDDVHPDDDDSITSYMDQLLKRMRGEEQAEGLLASSPSQPQPSTLQTQEDGLESFESLSSSSPKPFIEDSMRPEEFLPKHTAPERDLNLSEMRRLANEQTKSALADHERRGLRKRANGRRYMGYCMLVMAALIFFSGASDVLGCVGGAVAIFAGLYWITIPPQINPRGTIR